MRQLFVIIILTIFNGLTNLFGQTTSDSIYHSWWANKDKSIFQSVDNGTFTGTTNGYVQVKNEKDTTILDFQASKTTLKVTHDPNEMYDKSTKRYTTQTTSGKTTLSYEIYALANILTVNLNGLSYSMGIIDGASDMPILGLNFNYCSEKNTEYLTLYVTKPLELTTAKEVMRLKKVNYPEAQKLAKTITILSGSTLILTIRANGEKSVKLEKTQNTYTPDRADNIPKNAFWVGGADGGNWYLVDKIDSLSQTIHFKIYNDYNGNLIVDKVFKLYCDSDTKINLSDVKNLINAFDGQRIFLTTINRNNKYCYFE